jgi:ribonucleotide reductase beta subunit family protein with ferritin-like domain
VRTSEIINEEINRFYEKIKIEMKKTLGGDEILLLFIYVTAKSQLNNFYTHLKLIENFATSHILNSISGYYFVTLQVCLGHLENLADEAKNLDEDENLLTETITNCLSEIRKSFSMKSKNKGKNLGKRRISKSFMV